MNRLFVLTRAFDCEGEMPIGVMASLDLAKAIAQKQAADWGCDSTQWAEVNGRLELQFGSTQWVIREEEIQGFEYDCCESMRLYGRCNA